MKKLFVLLLPLSFALTPVSDTVYTATGSRALTGSYLLIKWPRFASGANHAVLPNTQTVQLVNGAFRVSLEATTTSQHPFHYTVEYHLISAGGPVPAYIETWDVPDTATPQSIANVLVTSPAASGPPPFAKGDLSTSDGVSGLVLHAPQQAGYILETDPAAPSGLSYQTSATLTASSDPAGAATAAAAQSAAIASANSAILALGLQGAAQHPATDFDAAGTAASAQAAAKTYTDNAIAGVTAGAVTAAQIDSAVSNAIASIPTSGASQTNPALLTPADWAVFNGKQAALTVNNDSNVTGSVSGGTLTLGWTGTPAKTRLLSSAVFTDQANTFAAGNKQTLTASSSTAGLNLTQTSANPATLANGDIWMRSDLSHILFYSGNIARTVLNNADVLGYSTQSGLVGTGSNFTTSNTMICLDANLNVSTTTCNSPVPAAPTAGTLGGVKTINCGPGSHVNSVSTAGVLTCTADLGSTITFKQPYVYDQTNYYIPEDAMSVASLPSAIAPSMAFLTGTAQSPGVPPSPQTNGDVILADAANNGPYYCGAAGSSSIEAVMTFGGGSAPKLAVWVWDSTLNKMYIFPVSQGTATMSWQSATYNGTKMGSPTNVNNVYVPLAQTVHLKLSVNSSTGFVTLQQTVNAGGYWNTLVNSSVSFNHPAQFGIMFSSDTIDVKSLKIQ